MKAETYLNALLRANWEMAYCVQKRTAGVWGIIVSDDPIAQRYQKLSKQSMKFEKRLREKLASATQSEV